VEAAAAGDCGGHGSRGIRPRAEECAEGDVDGEGDGPRAGRHLSGDREAHYWTRGQFELSADRREYRYGAGDAGERERAGAVDSPHDLCGFPSRRELQCLEHCKWVATTDTECCADVRNFAVLALLFR